MSSRKWISHGKKSYLFLLLGTHLMFLMQEASLLEIFYQKFWLNLSSTSMKQVSTSIFIAPKRSFCIWRTCHFDGLAKRTKNLTSCLHWYNWLDWIDCMQVNSLGDKEGHTKVLKNLQDSYRRNGKSFLTTL